MKLNLMMEDFIFLTSKGISCNILEINDLDEVWITSDNLEIRYFNNGERRIEVYGRFIGSTWNRLDDLSYSEFNPKINFGLKSLLESMIKVSQ